MLKVSGRHAAFAIAVLSIILLSSNATVAILAGDGASFVWFSLLCSLVTVAGLAPVLARRALQVTKRAAATKFFWIAILTKAVNDLAFYFAIIESKSIAATIIVYLYPVLNVILGAVILERSYQRLSRKEWSLLAVSFASVVLLTPISGLGGLSPVLFAAAALSAVASVYVVLIQSVADKLELPKQDELALIAAVFAGSIVLHILALILLAVAPNEALRSLTDRPTVSIGLLTGIVWIGLAINVFSEALWLRASRIYRAISLKSLFYLSPVLGAFYLAAFGIDDVTPVVLFCLTGVVAANFLVHQHQIDDVSYSAFLFGLIASTVTLQLTGTDDVLASFLLSSDAFQTQITLVSILTGFVIFRAFDIYQASWNATTSLLLRTSQIAQVQGVDFDILERGFDKLMIEPDVIAWTVDPDADEASWQTEFRDLLMGQDLQRAYYDFFCARLSGLSRPERFLIYIVCISAIPTTLAQSIANDSGAFFAAFSCALFAFLPVFVDDQAKFRSGRPLHGVTLRRAFRLELVTHQNSKPSEFPPAELVYLRNQKFVSAITFFITLAAFVASWWLLET